MVCELCGKQEGKLVKEYTQQKKGYVNGIFKGDVWCAICRRQERKNALKLLKTQVYYRRLGLATDDDIALYKDILKKSLCTTYNWEGDKTSLVEVIDGLTYLLGILKDTKQFPARLEYLNQLLLSGRYHKPKPLDDDWDTLPAWSIP